MIDLTRVKNTYYVMRHGQSKANVEKTIVSSPENGLTGFGLSDKGKAQVALAIEDFPELDDKTRIFASDFLRTKQTAEVAGKALRIKYPIVHTPLLRERFFGDLELGSDTLYEKVWATDAKTPDATGFGAEPVYSVLERIVSCVQKIEKEHSGQHILLVSHGDTLQIFLTYLKGWPPNRHREIDHLDVARIRKALP